MSAGCGRVWGIMGCVCGKDSLSVQDCRFTVQHRLGEGGFSVIDLVRDTRTRRLYALKRIACHSAQDESAALQEAQYMRAARHRNLVPCVAYGVNERTRHGTALSEVLIAMPYYRKGSLHDEIETLRLRAAHMQEQRVVTLLRGVCEGLHALHTLRPTPLAHRDVKPHNVMLEVGERGEDTPILMDFGSMGPARVEITSRAQATALQDLAGEKCSMSYRAPELFQVDSHCVVSELVDIWSLGCTVHALCFYESPFDKVHQRGDSIALAALAGNIALPPHSDRYSQALLQLMLNMMSVSATDRPSAALILSSLSQIYPPSHPTDPPAPESAPNCAPPSNNVHLRDGSHAPGGVQSERTVHLDAVLVTERPISDAA